MGNNLLNLSDFWDCENCSPKPDCFNGLLTPELQQQLKKVVRCMGPVSSSRYLYRMNDPFHSIYIVKSGAIKLQNVSNNGNKQIFGFYFPGDVIGIDSIETEFYISDAITMGNTSVCKISYERFKFLCLEIPTLQEKLFNKLSSEIRQNQERSLLKSPNLHLDVRLLDFIKTLSKRIGENQKDGSITIDLPMSHIDIANYFGVRSETITRTIHKLSDKGIEKNGKNKLLIRAGYTEKLDRYSVSRISRR